jgi:hypothetical protein
VESLGGLDAPLTCAAVPNTKKCLGTALGMQHLYASLIKLWLKNARGQYKDFFIAYVERTPVLNALKVWEAEVMTVVIGSTCCL